MQEVGRKTVRVPEGRALRQLGHLRAVEYDRGSHYAAHDVADLLLEDLRGFFEALR